MKPPTLQHRVEFALTRSVEAALSGLSAHRAERVGEALGAFVRTPLGIRRRVVEGNLRLAFPGATDEWIEETVSATYRHLGREAVAMLRLSALDAAAIRDTVEITERTWQNVQEALSGGRGVLLATGHYGNWEMAAAAVAARGVPIEAIVKRQSNPLVDRRIEAARAALGVETVNTNDAPRRVPRALLANKGIGIVADQDARHVGIQVPFFGVPASTHRGPAHFALRVRSPIIAAVARRLPEGGYRLTGDLIDTTPTGDLEADVYRITAALAAHLEQEIRKEPAQYFWFHKRWKTSLAEEPLPRVAGTKTHNGPG